jgi:Putative Ig domain/PKD domain/RTX calcium-binding nonapeptide repeat (4 copies)
MLRTLLATCFHRKARRRGQAFGSPIPTALRSWVRRLPLRLELLEERATPALVTWDGGGDGINWSDPLNWTSDTAPVNNDDVVIDTPGAAVNYATGPLTLNSLTSVRSLTVTGGALTVAGAAEVDDTLTISAGTLTLNGTSSVTNLNQIGGTIRGIGTVTLNGAASWTGGIWDGAGHTINNGTVTINGSAQLSNGRSLDNLGIVALAGGSLALNNAAVFNNLPGATFDIRGDFNVSGSVTSAISNSGTIEKSAGTGTSEIDPALVNFSSVQVLSGSLRLKAGSSISSFTVAGGSTLILDAQYTFGSGTVVTGAGFISIPSMDMLTISAPVHIDNLRLDGGKVLANAALDVQNLVLSASGGELTGPATVTVNGSLNWVAGKMTGTGATKLLGASTISGGALSTLDRRTIDNAGTATVVEGGFNFTNNAIWNNLSGSTLVLSGSAALGSISPGTAAFNNAGTLDKQGTGTSDVAIPLNNSGMLDVQSGQLNATIGVTNSGTVGVETGATLSGSYVQTAGDTSIAAGGILSVPTGAAIQGGTLEGNGTVDVGAGTLVSAGTVRPGSPVGALTVLGNYTQTASGTLAIELAGTTPGVSFDQLVITGTANLDGTLAVSALGGYLPNFGDSFRVLTFASSSGQFANYVGLDLGSSRLLVPVYNPTDLTLANLATNRPPVLDPIPDQSVDEGSTLIVPVHANDPDAGQTLTYALDGNVPAGASIDPATGVLTFTPADGPASYTFTVYVTDNGQPPLTNTTMFTVTVNNVDPSVNLPGPTALNEGGTFAGSGSFTDPGADTWTATVNYGDGSGDQALALKPDHTFALSHLYTDNGPYTVTVMVSDGDGGVGVQTLNVLVANVAPTVTVSGPGDGLRGQTLTFSFSAVDPSPVDQAAGFTFTINWGDGSSDIASAVSSLTLEHSYAASGSYTVAVTATDKDGGASAVATQSVTVVAVVGAELQPGGVLVVVGTSGDDQILFSRARNDPNAVRLTINGQRVGIFPGVTRIVAFGQAGDDFIALTGSRAVPAELYGGAGNDVLLGGAGPDILVGGAGNDLLLGKQGRDLLIGGPGSDILVGGPGGDILIAGDFMAGASFGDQQVVLRAVSDKWTAPLRYTARVAALTGVLAPRVSDDGVRDYLIGSSDQDWFFALVRGANADVILGHHSREAITHLGS